MRKLLSFFTLTLLYITFAFGQQPEILIELGANDGSLPSSLIVSVGLDLTATDGIDVALGEAALPPLAPGLDVRFQVGTVQSYQDYRAPGAPYPWSGTIQHNILLQRSGPGLAINIAYSLPTGAAMRITDKVPGNPFLNIGPFTGTGTAVIPVAYLDLFGSAWLYMDYTNIAPVGPAPEFSINPAFANFGSIFVGSTATTTAAISNSGTGDLVVQQPAPVGAFSVTGPFPITIPEGGPAVDVTITFAPTSEGAQSADLAFNHNAAGTPFLFPVTGTGAGTAPIFRQSVLNLNFGLVTPLTSVDLTVTVYNDGLVDPLNVNAAIVAPEFVVNPPTASILAGGSQVFTVTFTPPAVGQYNGQLVFTHDAAGSPDQVALVGFGYVPAAEFGLIFEKDTVYQLEDNSYMEVIQLRDVKPGDLIKAIQFRLKTNQATDDNTILTFQSITKGSSVADPSWILETNVVRGTINSNGASEDVIYVLLYNIEQGPGYALSSGDWNDMFHVTYKIADLPALKDSIKSSIQIANEEASTFDGFPIDITGSRDYLVVKARNRVSSLGDVNADGCLDILDLIMVVDHIVGRDSLDTTPTPGFTTSEFERANIAPWIDGAEFPTPDLVVNVQDLSLIQNIILTGFFPNDVPVGDCSFAQLPKVEGDADAEVNVYISNEGITVYLDSKVGIRGAQMEFDNVTDNTGNLVINTDLGQGYYLQTDKLLRTLMYDRLGVKYIAQGEHFMADMPFTITNPENIVLDKLVLVDINTQRVMKIQVNIIYETAPVPLDYILYQNYPNPFNPSTSVKFQVPQTSNVTIKVFDMLGQEVRTLFTGEVLRGTYTVEWDGLNDAGQQMSSGSYVYRMIAGEFMQAKKMVYVK